MQLTNFHPLVVGDVIKIHIIYKDAKSTQPRYFANFHKKVRR